MSILIGVRAFALWTRSRGFKPKGHWWC